MYAIITGASRGIGNAIAKKLVAEGVHVAICARNAEHLQSAVAELKQINSNVEIISQVCDLSKKEEVLEFGKFVVETFPCIDILINNAGVFIPGEIHLEADGLLEKLMQTNLFSAYHLTRSIVPSMIKNNKGHIINISSVAGLQPYEHGGSYSISKYALQGFSKNLRNELKTFGIKVTTVNPGATMSDSWSGSQIDPSRILEAKDIADSIWNTLQLSPQAVVEDIILRPLLGDL